MLDDYYKDTSITNLSNTKMLCGIDTTCTNTDSKIYMNQ